MTRFAVDTAELRMISQVIRDAAAEAEAAASDQRALSRHTAALLDPVLVGAMSEFVNRWAVGLRTLVDDAHRLADGLDLAIAYYVDTEIGIRTALGGGGGSGPWP